MPQMSISRPGATPSIQYGISSMPEMLLRMVSLRITLLQRRICIGHLEGTELPAIVYEHGADIEALMPKLRHSDYYTQPKIQELAAKKRAEPGFCRHVKDFVVGSHGYGSIKFFGETAVRRLDLESIVQFNNREVIVYLDESKKTPSWARSE